MTEPTAPHHAPAGAPHATPTRRRLARGPALWTVAVATVAMLAASSAPSPLYPVLEAKIGFSALTLTVIFAVYVLALLGSLLVVGSLSDHVGRRPVLVAALLVETVERADLGVANARLQGGFITANQLMGPPLGALLFSIARPLPFGVTAICAAAGAVLFSAGSVRAAAPTGLAWGRG